jgi:hypothetical protein
MAGKLKGSALVDASVTEVQLAANIVSALANAAQVYGAIALAQTAYNQGSLAFDAANNSANTVAVSSNTGTLFGKQLNFINSPTIVVSVADDGANANIVINSIATDANILSAIYGQANSAYNQANVATNLANSNNTDIIGVNAALNAVNINIMLSHTDANNAFNVANYALILASTADNQADNARDTANVALNKATNTENFINGTIYPYVNTVFTQANTAYTAANNALNVAIAASNTVTISQNTNFILENKKLNFVNTANISITLSDSGNGFANVVITGFSGNFVRLANEPNRNATTFLVFTSNTSGNLLSANVSTTKLTFNPNTGILSATIFNSLSDINEKRNIETIENALDMLQQIRGVRFNWRETGNPSLGVIAQEIINVAPELVNENNSGILTVNYSGINAILIEAMKSMHFEIKEMRTEIEKLKNVSPIK